MLYCPTTDEILKVRKARNEGKINASYLLPLRENFSNNPHDHFFVPLGSFSRIRRDAASCGLCRLFCSVLARQGGVYRGNMPIPIDDEVCFEATTDMNYHGIVTESVADGEGMTRNGLITLRRLSLVATFMHVATGGPPDIINFASFRGVAQACNTADLINSETYSSATCEAPLNKNSMLFAGRRRPLVIDIDLVQSWREICVLQHRDTCVPVTEWSDLEYDNFVRPLVYQKAILIMSRPTTHIHLRLVDVQQRCVQSFKNVVISSLSYVALSYVWGNCRFAELKSSNETSLYEKGSLSQLSLPKTIVDAMDLTRSLEVRYLWVDALCIQQDDAVDIRYQLSNMANIYQCAELTIIAASGDNSDAGLAGLHPGTRCFQPKYVHIFPASQERPALSLLETCRSYPTSWDANYRPLHEDVDTSTWNSRAWTLQERVLSRRSLIFTKEQIFWVCDGGLFCEESKYEHPDLGYAKSAFDTQLRFESFNNSLTALNLKTVGGPWSQMRSQRKFWLGYSLLVEAYTQRNLKHLGDIYDAFQAICSRYERLSQDNFLWGHPRSRFELSLLWTSRAPWFELRRRTAVTTLPMTELRSQIQLPSWSWMGWVGPVSFQIDDERMEFTFVEISCYIHQKILLKLVQVSRPCRFDSETYRGDDLKTGDLPDRNETQCSVDWSHIDAELPELTRQRLQSIPESQIIFFWALSAFFVVEPPQDFHPYEMENYRSILRPIVRSATTKAVVGSVDRMDIEHWTLISNRTEQWEFIRIGRTEVPEAPFLPHSPATILALQIWWQDGIAYRLNLAEISEDAWLDASPVRKLVALS